MRKHATCPHSRIIRHQTPNYGRLGPLRLDFFLSPDHIAGLDVAQGRGLNPIDRRLSDRRIIEITSTSSGWGSSGLPDPWASPRPRRSAVTSWIPPEPVVIILDPAVWPLYGLGRIDGDGFGGYPTRRADCSHPPLSWIRSRSGVIRSSVIWRSPSFASLGVIRLPPLLILRFTTEPESKRKQTNINFGNTLSGYLWLFGCLFDIWIPVPLFHCSINLLWIRSA